MPIFGSCSTFTNAKTAQPVLLRRFGLAYRGTAILCGMAPRYVKAALILLASEDEALINAVMDGCVHILSAADMVKGRAYLEEIEVAFGASISDAITDAAVVCIQLDGYEWAPNQSRMRPERVAGSKSRGRTMIRPVDRKHFDVRHHGHPLLHKELAWFATEDDNVLGVVVLDLVDHDYSWVLLTQNDQGPDFTAVDLNASLPTEVAATRALHDAMMAWPALQGWAR